MKMIIILTFLLITMLNFCLSQKQCTERGGCKCKCEWATEKTCKKDDGSCCFGCCCGSLINSINNSKSEIKSTNKEEQETYCPSANDLVVAYGKPEIFDQGWTINKGAGVATKAAFNLLGGSVEYDFDVTGVKPGINANIYTISPTGIESDGFKKNKNYCDGSKPEGNEWCVEVDWIESNGSCAGQTALHIIPGEGNKGCTAWGCSSKYLYNGKTSFHMKITYEPNGVWNTYRDGEIISSSSLKPIPNDSDWNTLAKFYSQRGAVIYSSQWKGWVPLPEKCGKSDSGDLNESTFSVKNLKITGSVIQGPKPKKCKTIRRKK